MLRDRSARMQNRAVLDWNDLRHFLAVAETGSTLAAGRSLRVSQTTAARRVAALEEALHLTLFDRRASGYILTPAGEALLDHARAVERAAQGFSDAAAAQAREAGGVVRLSAIELLTTTLLPGILRDLHRAHPAIRIELDASDEPRDLSTESVDVALRYCRRPEGSGLVARRLFDDVWTVYCSRGYAETHGRPMNRRELPGHEFVGGGEPGVWRLYRSWLATNGLEDAVAIRHSSSTGLLAAVRAGMGLAVLPRHIADQDPDLVRCLRSPAGEERGLWLVTHERLRHTPRVRTVMEFLAERLIPFGRFSEPRAA